MFDKGNISKIPISSVFNHFSTSRKLAELRKRDDFDELGAFTNRLSAFEIERQWEQHVEHVNLEPRVTGLCDILKGTLICV